MTTILEEAEALVSGDRQRAYGHPCENLTLIARLWGNYLSNLPIELTPYDVAMMMILVKVARAANGATRDTLVDIAGYARVAEMLGE